MTRGARAVVLCPDIRALRYDLDAVLGALRQAPTTKPQPQLVDA